MTATLRIGLIVLLALSRSPCCRCCHSGFIVTLMNYIGIYTLITLGLVLLTGCGGITSFGQAAFVGIGAYATAYLTTAMGLVALGRASRRHRADIVSSRSCSATSRCISAGIICRSPPSPGAWRSI